MHDPEATEAEAVAATAAAQAQAQQEQQEQERRTALLFPHLAHIPAALAPEALLDAVNEGSVPLVHDLVKRDPGLANHRDGFGQTPLMWAVRACGHVCGVLCRRGWGLGFAWWVDQSIESRN
jgi:hypothetical protein